MARYAMIAGGNGTIVQPVSACTCDENISRLSVRRRAVPKLFKSDLWWNCAYGSRSFVGMSLWRIVAMICADDLLNHAGLMRSLNICAIRTCKHKMRNTQNVKHAKFWSHWIYGQLEHRNTKITDVALWMNAPFPEPVKRSCMTALSASIAGNATQCYFRQGARKLGAQTCK